MTDTVQDLRRQLQQLRAQHESGALGDSDYAKRSAALERRLVDAVVAGPAAPATETVLAHEAPAGAAPVRAGGRLWAALAGVGVLVAAAGYWWTGSPQELGAPPPGFGAQAAADGPAVAGSAPHAMDKEQFTAMTERLAVRMKAEPDNVEGWAMLGRSYMALGEEAKGLAAFEHVVKLRPDDATALADYADALAMKNGRSLDGEPTRIIERALKLDPDNLKALMLGGTVAFNRADYALAVQHWERAARVGPPDSPMVQQARNGVAEARQLGKLPAAVPSAGTPTAAAAGNAQPAPAAGASPVAQAGPGKIEGTVSLAPALKGKVAAEDAVFIVARPAEGSRMPLAFLRKQVKDLPFKFELNDSLAMSPAANLSSAAGPVVVVARVSKTGQPMPQSGDLEGISTPFAVGSVGVGVVIANEVKK